VQNGIHFVSGLPRAGSTSLAALSRRNARMDAGMTSPVGSLFSALLRMSQENEAAVLIDDDQRARRCATASGGYYADIHRESWCSTPTGNGPPNCRHWSNCFLICAWSVVFATRPRLSTASSD